MAPSRAEQREGVGQDARDRFHVPRERRDQHERRERLGVEVQLVFEQEPQGKPADDAGLRDRGHERAEPDHDVVLAQRETGVGGARRRWDTHWSTG